MMSFVISLVVVLGLTKKSEGQVTFEHCTKAWTGGIGSAVDIDFVFDDTELDVQQIMACSSVYRGEMTNIVHCSGNEDDHQETEWDSDCSAFGGTHAAVIVPRDNPAAVSSCGMVRTRPIIPAATGPDIHLESSIGPMKIRYCPGSGEEIPQVGFGWGWGVADYAFQVTPINPALNSDPQWQAFIEGLIVDPGMDPVGIADKLSRMVVLAGDSGELIGVLWYVGDMRWSDGLDLVTEDPDFGDIWVYTSSIQGGVGTYNLSFPRDNSFR